MENENNAVMNLENGEYTVEVELGGGSGRAQVTSPAELFVEDGQAYARVEWSSSYYDYMKVEDKQYFPVNEEGNSVFEIPVTMFDDPIEVTADTTAMSRPHEVEYTLTFVSSSIAPSDAGGSKLAGGIVLAALLFLAVFAALRFARKKRRKSE